MNEQEGGGGWKTEGHEEDPNSNTRRIWRQVMDNYNTRPESNEWGKSGYDPVTGQARRSISYYGGADDALFNDVWNSKQ